MPVRWYEFEIQVFKDCARIPLVCNACGWQTERDTPPFEDLKSYEVVRQLRAVPSELSLLQRIKMLFDRFPESRHPARVDKLHIRLPDGSEDESDPQFEAAMREDPEVAECLCPSVGITSFYLPARLKYISETVSSLEERLPDLPVTHCPSCNGATLQIPDSFIESQFAVLREARGRSQVKA